MDRKKWQHTTKWLTLPSQTHDQHDDNECACTLDMLKVFLLSHYAVHQWLQHQFFHDDDELPVKIRFHQLEQNFIKSRKINFDAFSIHLNDYDNRDVQYH